MSGAGAGGAGAGDLAAGELSGAIRAALLTGEARAKVRATRDLARASRRGQMRREFSTLMPDHPQWPAGLQVLPPAAMPRRGRGGSARARIALWHALAHIEFVAMDLALDMAGRFGGAMEPDFVDDFLQVAAEEAMHFALIARHLAAMGARYGDLPVHGGMWQAAQQTAHDIAARLAVVPLVLEARALDVTPATRERVLAQGDARGAQILQRILDDEIRHVAVGAKHFLRICRQRSESPPESWQKLVARHFAGRVKPPFNDSARASAGLSREFYVPIA